MKNASLYVNFSVIFQVQLTCLQQGGLHIYIPECSEDWTGTKKNIEAKS